MIIKLKNGIDYLLLKREGEYYLLTDQKEKTDSSFEWWRTHYRKKIDPYDECVEECYDVSFHVIYDVGIPGVTDKYLEKKISIKNGRKCDPKRKERVYMSKKEFAEFWINSL